MALIGDDPERAPQSAHESAWYAQREALYSGGNEVTLLTGGDQLFPAMHAAIGRARHEVWLATYIFHDDIAGRDGRRAGGRRATRRARARGR